MLFSVNRKHHSYAVPIFCVTLSLEATTFGQNVISGSLFRRIFSLDKGSSMIDFKEVIGWLQLIDNELTIGLDYQVLATDNQNPIQGNLRQEVKKLSYIPKFVLQSVAGRWLCQF